MRKLKIVGLAVMALLVLGAMAVSSASAAKPEFSPATNSGTSSGGAAKFTEVGGIAEVTCTGSEGTSRITSARLGTFDELFLGCTAPLSGKCTGLPDTTKGSILVRGTFHLRYIPGKAKTAIIFLIEPVHFECEKIVTLILVRGCAVGTITPTNRKSKTFTIALKQRGGHEEFTEVENEASSGNEVCMLESEKNGEAFRVSGQENTDTIVEETEGEIQA